MLTEIEFFSLILDWNVFEGFILHWEESVWKKIRKKVMKTRPNLGMTKFPNSSCVGKNLAFHRTCELLVEAILLMVLWICSTMIILDANLQSYVQWRDLLWSCSYLMQMQIVLGSRLKARHEFSQNGPTQLTMCSFEKYWENSCFSEHVKLMKILLQSFPCWITILWFSMTNWWFSESDVELEESSYSGKYLNMY